MWQLISPRPLFEGEIDDVARPSTSCKGPKRSPWPFFFFPPPLHA